MTAKVFGVAGWKNSGKTGLVERLVGEFVARGWKVTTVKHAHHSFDIDHEGTDSFRHRAAGAREVAIVSRRRWALVHEIDVTEDEPALKDILARLSPADLVIVEGYKRDHHKKIEVRRREARDSAPVSPGDPSIVAIAADYPLEDEGLPVFDLDDLSGIADFVARECGLELLAGSASEPTSS
jgi:molybdopterin-guanine dinucleotide biosynthesis adapter protein